MLAATEAEFILVGGLAAIAHGSARLTQDLDVVYRRTPDNLERIVKALSPHAPYLRGAPPGLPFRFDVPTLKAGLNFTLQTDHLETLIRVKRAAGRPKDLEAVAELNPLMALRRR